jgi:AraC family transcriptional activator of pobA
MTRKHQLPHVIDSVAAMHSAFGLPKPEHPLVSVINFEKVNFTLSDVWDHFVINLYCVAIKKGVKGKMKYGQTYYDFDEGVMTLTAPKQVMSVTNTDEIALSGYLMYFHPDFLQGYPLMKTIREYGFFSYELHEALLLSAKEEESIIRIMKEVEQEYHASIDRFSQDVIISHIELLLVYANRFYNRQFITRKNLNHDVLSKLEAILDEYFNGDKVKEMGLPTVKYISDQLNVSPGYLSDLLKNLTGQTTQQHIHGKVIDKAKEILLTTSLSVSEIAYQLGFEYPQSFNKLFKSKTNISPLEFRQSVN